jgi:phenylpropionate dioxygenase-like ring-hydroxylating dioxygenase large terminal subunit
MNDLALPADWARTLVDPEAFAQEQARLAHVWTFLGVTHDLARDGDWITASLATRSVFVQRFGGELKGFENLCAHRFYPVRTAERGNGPVVCGFHHWRYDKDGQAIGIPACEETFGVVSRALGARLNPIEVATCGALVFGRFSAPHATQSLEEFLGDGFAALAALSRWRAEPATFALYINANWRLSMHISLDDYHLAAVHPRSLGRAGYLRRSALSYARFGLHSAQLATNAAGAFETYVAACRDGSLVSSHYTILQVLPDLNLAHSRTDGPFYICLLHQFVPLAHDRSLLRAWIYPAPFDGPHSWFTRWTRPITQPFRTRLAAHVVRRIFRQDIRVCERLQAAAHQVGKAPRLGALEERIAWFEESYRRLLADNVSGLGGGDKAKQE